MINPTNRIQGLDLLRGVAIVLVLFRHSELHGNPLRHFGWLGVDLFFVLSGFLVSSLLFKEWKKNGKVNIKRFLLRRGFKIYPPFYFFMLATVLAAWLRTDKLYPPSKLLAEAFYLQTYLPHIWDHTWSLAVEEHFYLFLSLFVVLLVGFKVMTRKVLVIGTLAALLTVSFLLRLDTALAHRYLETYGFIETHLRADGVLIGLLIGYLYHFTNFANFLNARKWLFLTTAALLIAPAFYFKGGSFFMNTVGLTTTNLGFGILTLLALNIAVPQKGFAWKSVGLAVSAMAFIGIHSYSIYLWHLNARDIAEAAIAGDRYLTAGVYMLLALGVGIGLSYLVEAPFLKLRDRVLKGG